MKPCASTGDDAGEADVGSGPPRRGEWHGGRLRQSGPSGTSKGPSQGQVRLSERTWSRMRRELVGGGKLRPELSSESGSI